MKVHLTTLSPFTSKVEDSEIVVIGEEVGGERGEKMESKSGLRSGRRL